MSSRPVAAYRRRSSRTDRGRASSASITASVSASTARRCGHASRSAVGNRSVAVAVAVYSEQEGSPSRSVRCYSREPESMLDELSQAVLAREEVVKYLRGGYGENEERARERVHAYLDELRTTQRYEFYRALQHPLYPILRKIEQSSRAHAPRRRRDAQPPRRVRVEPQEPHRLPGRTDRARRCRRAAAAHRGRHQPVRRAARAAAPPHHRARFRSGAARRIPRT